MHFVDVAESCQSSGKCGFPICCNMSLLEFSFFSLVIWRPNSWPGMHVRMHEQLNLLQPQGLRILGLLAVAAAEFLSSQAGGATNNKHHPHQANQDNNTFEYIYIYIYFFHNPQNLAL